MNVEDSEDKEKSLSINNNTDSEISNDLFLANSDDDVENESDENSASFSETVEFLESDRNFGSESNSQKIKNNPGSSDNERRSSLVTSTFRYDRKKPENLFPPTKKYRYYPVTCDYCRKRFQPNKLKAHQRKHHLSGTAEIKPARKVQSAAVRRGFEKQPSTSRSKSAGGMPRQLQMCYICGQMYGSMSLKIHEPKCLDKWRIQNRQLPPELRAKEPVKPEPEIMPSVGTGKTDYDIPEFDPKAEAAYRSHLSTLIPCSHCSRTFSPDRIQKHMSCCIERPRPSIRECITPTRDQMQK